MTVSPEEFIKMAAKRPGIFCMKAKNIENKLDDLKTNEIHITLNSAESIYSCILKYLVFGKVGKYKNYTKDIVEHIKLNPEDKFEYTIPDGKIVQGFLDYVKKITKEYLKKDIIKINIEKNIPKIQKNKM